MWRLSSSATSMCSAAVFRKGDSVPNPNRSKSPRLIVPGSQKQLISLIVSHVFVAEANLVEHLLEVFHFVVFHLGAQQNTAVGRTVVAVMEHGDVPARAQVTSGTSASAPGRSGNSNWKTFSLVMVGA